MPIDSKQQNINDMACWSWLKSLSIIFRNVILSILLFKFTSEIKLIPYCHFQSKDGSMYNWQIYGLNEQFNKI